MENYLNVLVIDDEIGLRLGIGKLLKRYTTRFPEFADEIHFRVSSAETGMEGLDFIENNKVDILILDHKLPDIQGLDILSILRKEEKKEIYTIMVTAFASLEVAISATRQGAFDFLSKPFTPEEFRSCIDKVSKHIFLHRKAQMLEKEKKQMRFQFISVLAHELKAPLAAIEGYLDIMDSKIAGDSIDKYLPMIGRSKIRINGMRKLILDLLDLTRIESGNRRRNIIITNIMEAVGMSLENVMPDAGQKGVKIHTEAPESLIMNADPDEIQIIFNNILTNAVKYNKDNGKVHLSIKDEGENIRIICTDTGIGMSKEEKDRLFGEFIRIKNKKTRDIMGSGLGLSILKKTAELYGGSVSVDSEPDIGTTFTLVLNKSFAPISSQEDSAS